MESDKSVKSLRFRRITFLRLFHVWQDGHNFSISVHPFFLLTKFEDYSSFLKTASKPLEVISFNQGSLPDLLPEKNFLMGEC